VSIGGQLRSSFDAVRALRARPAVLRLVGALILRWTGTSMAMIAYLVVAYRAGGTAGVAILGAAHMVPAAIVAALTGRLSERVGHEQLLVNAYLARAVAMALATAAVAMNLPIPIVFASVALSGAAGGLIRPLHAGVLPHVARTPGELIAANVATSTGEGAATLVGPAIGGLLLIATSTAGTLLVSTGLAIGAAALAASARATAHAIHPPGRRHRTAVERPSAIRALRESPGAALVVAGFAAQTFVRGVVTTLIVVSSFDLLGLGDAGIGWLSAAMGVGGLISALLSTGDAVRHRLAVVFVAALVGWSLPIAFIGGWPIVVVAFTALLVNGFSNATLDVTGYTLLQRALPSRAVVTVLGFLEALIGLSIATGSLLSPFLIGVLGVKGALLATGAMLPIVALLIGPGLLRGTHEKVVPEQQLAAFRRVPLFEPLPLTTLEDLARAARPVSFAPGDFLMREGEPGDRYLVLTDGRVEVSQANHVLRACGPGEGIGEIALLRRVPRTATVQAIEVTEAYALEGGAFISAITGHRLVSASADSLITERLAPEGAARGVG
jgi:MFS family permease